MCLILQRHSIETTIFYIISQLSSFCPQLNEILWHYSECGHGKGAPDGVGGVLKRTADQLVAYGNDSSDINTLIEILKTSVKGVIIDTVEAYEITEKNWLLKTFSGTLKVHQVVWTKKEPKRLALRSLSCIEQDCLTDAISCCSHGKHIGFHNFNSDLTDVVLPCQQQSHKIRNAKVQITNVRRFKASEKYVLDPHVQMKPSV